VETATRIVLELKQRFCRQTNGNMMRCLESQDTFAMTNEYQRVFKLVILAPQEVQKQNSYYYSTF
jgi:hypothetical protein